MVQAVDLETWNKTVEETDLGTLEIFGLTVSCEKADGRGLGTFEPGDLMCNACPVATACIQKKLGCSAAAVQLVVQVKARKVKPTHSVNPFDDIDEMDQHKAFEEFLSWLSETRATKKKPVYGGVEYFSEPERISQLNGWCQLAAAFLDNDSTNPHIEIYKKYLDFDQSSLSVKVDVKMVKMMVKQIKKESAEKVLEGFETVEMEDLDGSD